MPTVSAIASAVKARRRPGAIAVNLTLSIEADELLELFAGGQRNKGHFVERLLREHAIRIEERRRIQEGRTRKLD